MKRGKLILFWFLLVSLSFSYSQPAELQNCIFESSCGDVVVKEISGTPIVWIMDGSSCYQEQDPSQPAIPQYVTPPSNIPQPEPAQNDRTAASSQELVSFPSAYNAIELDDGYSFQAEQNGPTYYVQADLPPECILLASTGDSEIIDCENLDLENCKEAEECDLIPIKQPQENIGLLSGCIVQAPIIIMKCINKYLICTNDNDCDDNNLNTLDACSNPGTENAHCIHIDLTCSSNEDCIPGMMCDIESGICVPGEGFKCNYIKELDQVMCYQECILDNQCNENEKCRNDKCIRRCYTDTDCGSGFRCLKDEGSSLFGEGLCSRIENELICGNDILEIGEECDDGNINSGDGCNASCIIEEGYECTQDSLGFVTCVKTTQEQFNPDDYKCQKNNQHICTDGNTAWCCPPSGISNYGYQLCPGEKVNKPLCKDKTAPSGTSNRCYENTCFVSESKWRSGTQAIPK